MNDNIGVPKIIHQIWFQGYNIIPEKYNENIKKNRTLNKNFEYMFWDDSSMQDIMTEYGFTDIYNSFKYMLQKIDFARYVILYKYGGVFIDMDAYCIKSLNGLFDKLHKLNSGFEIAISNMNVTVIESYAVCGKPVFFNNANIIAKPNAKFLKSLINRIVKNNSNANYPFYKTQMSVITNTTGPVFVTEFIFEYKNKNELIMLDFHVLEPCKTTICDITDETYIVHNHESSWINKPIKILMDVYIKYNPLLIIIICIILYYFFAKYITI